MDENRNQNSDLDELPLLDDMPELSFDGSDMGDVSGIDLAEAGSHSDDHDLELDLSDPAGATGSEFDDFAVLDDLPDSDPSFDLPELEPAPGEEAGAADDAVPTSSFATDEDETVALTEDELENILGNADTDFFDDMGESAAPAAVIEDEGRPLLDFDDEPIGNVRSSDDLVPDVDLEPISPAADADLDVLDLETHSLPADEELGFDDFHPDVAPVSDSEIEPGTLDQDDEGPIALSEAELGSIMDDVDPELLELEGVADDELSFGDDEDLPSLDLADDGEDAAPAVAVDDEDDANITLTDDELSQVLLDTDETDDAISDTGHELTDAELEEVPDMPALSTLDMEDDEPIALTPEELGNIVSDMQDSSVVEAAGLDASPDDLVDEDDSDFELSGASVEDEGPIALSDSELDSILADTEPGDDQAGFAEGQVFDEDDDVGDHDEFADGKVIVLDEYDDTPPVLAEPPAAEAPKTVAETRAEAVSAMADSISADEGMDREELRTMISYLDGLFDKLPEDTIREFSRSRYFDLYKKIMSELGL